MTMFEELFALASSATLTLVISADDKAGRMTVNVIPKPKKEMDEPALTRALSLTDTPAEFDAEFVQTLKGYREARQSLAEQAEATREVLQAAKSASVKRAGDATAKAAKPAAAQTKPAPANTLPAIEVEDDESGTEIPAAPAAATSDARSYDLFG